MRIYKSDYGDILRKEIIRRYIEPVVLSIREELAKKYDIDCGQYCNYRGLCDKSIIMLINKMNGIDIADISRLCVDSIHGEQSHHPRLESKNWCMQHTWAVVKIFGLEFYVDPTSQQFKDFYTDIPDYYISAEKPKWYYPDDDNPAWRGLSNKINDVIEIRHKVWNKSDNKYYVIHDGIISFIQYEIWGKISDILRKVKKWK